MKTIVAINAKGGVGKSTFVVFLTEALAAKGKRVLVCDLDPARAAYEVLTAAKRVDPLIRVLARTTAMPPDFQADYRIIDTVGNSDLTGVLRPFSGPSLRPDMFVVPTNASTFDLRQLGYTTDALKGFSAAKRILWCRIQANTRITRPEILSNYMTMIRAEAFNTMIPHSVHYAQIENSLKSLTEDKRKVWINLADELEQLLAA